MAIFLTAQIGLGATVIWTSRNAYYTTAHVIVGALTLSAAFLLTWGMHRDVLENASDGARPGRQAGSPALGRIPARA